MKYSSLFLALFPLALSAITMQAQSAAAENTEIQLQVDGLPYTLVRLQNVHENIKSQLDSIRLDSNGNAVFKYAFHLDPGYYEIVLPDETILPLLLDRDQNLALTTAADRPVERMQVSGSFENSLLYNALQYNILLESRFQAEVEALQGTDEQELNVDVVDLLRQKYFTEQEKYYAGIFEQYPNTLFTKYHTAKQRPVILNAILADPSIDGATRLQLMLNHFWDNMDFTDERLLHTPVAFDKLWEYMNRFVPDQTAIKLQAVDILLEKASAHPAYYKFFAKWLADDYMPPFTAQMDPDAFYIHMVDRFLTKERAFWADSVQVYAWQFRATDMRANLVGMKGESFTAKDPQGKEHALNLIKSPYIALFFYHADCQHCIKETPVMVKKYRELKDQGLEVVAVAMGTPEDEWKAFIQKNGMDWINVTDENNKDIGSKYFVRATPEIFLLNPERTIIGKHLSPEDVARVMQMDRMQRVKNKENLAE